MWEGEVWGKTSPGKPTQGEGGLNFSSDSAPHVCRQKTRY